MVNLVRFWAAFREDLIHFAFVVDDAVHGRWPQPDVVIPDRVDRVEAPVNQCTNADLSAGAILDFLRSQKKPSTVFDPYVVAEMRREVNTDE